MQSACERWWASWLVLGVACGGPSVSTPPAPAADVSVEAPAVATAPHLGGRQDPAESASGVPASSSGPAASVPYPDAWVARAKVDNREHSCVELIYKRGCAEKRTGKITVRVTLSPDGKATTVEVLRNEIRLEPEVVEKCVVLSLPKWSFQPPEASSPTFELVLVFADKC